jgi:hypothetical protein
VSVSSALRKLRLRGTSQQYLEEFYRQINAEENDRGAAILAAITVDIMLTNTIIRRLPKGAPMYTQVFENQGPLGTFDGKIVIAQAFGIIGPNTRKNLDTIKHIRNTFAHAGIPITFSTPEIADACNSLVVPPNPRRFAEADLVLFTPRQRYTGICEATAVNLQIYATGCGYVRADRMRPDAMLLVTPAPLP